MVQWNMATKWINYLKKSVRKNKSENYRGVIVKIKKGKKCGNNLPY